VAQGLIRYRCFLPDLTGFTVPPCTGPNYQQSTSSLAQCCVGGEGGIRTLGTGLTAHTISSRAPSTARSPLHWKKSIVTVAGLVSEVSMSPKCLHRRFWGRFSNRSSNLTQQICRSKDCLSSRCSYTINYRASKNSFRFVNQLWSYVSMRSPR
jgi:hypothetical protein